jgi:porin
MMIGQADLDLGGEAQASLGVWGYTASFSQIDPTHPPTHGQGGVYGFVEGPAPIGKDWRGWLRAGLADPGADIIGSYLGMGLVRRAPLPGRQDDEAGIALARAGIGDVARRAFGLPDAETTLEGTYRFVAGPHLALQPDLQYVIHPASAPHLRNAFVVGLRFILEGEAPAGTEDEED